MANKTHSITVRINDLEYNYLQQLKFLREESQDHDTEYSYSDIMRIALGYMYDIELWGSKSVTFNKERYAEQRQYAIDFWKQSKCNK